MAGGGRGGGKPRGRFILIGGGARSGKSRFALQRALRLGRRRIFLATAQPFDKEMSERIARHRDERGAGFTTVEEPLNLPQALAAITGADVVLIDCLTLWLSNLLMREEAEAPALRRIDDLVGVVAARRRHIVLVSNEVGLGLVPDTPLGRLFRDLTGYAHQRLSAVADELYLGAMGQMLRLRPSPVTVVRPPASDRLR
jgi:adenosylcobinamide kinase/adenosylcobinamide-phosphate guanylyltransferase